MLRAATKGRWRALARAASPQLPPRRALSDRAAGTTVNITRGEGCAALQVGETYHNFVLTRKERVPEYNLDALELEHVTTKAKYMHIDAPDQNNVFSVMFRTPPASSNGIAHVLEHTVLCGSQRFPVRDPFFNMIKRSLNTYMNALTAYDHTMYPFSTVNEKDWKNLRAVYLDAVFFPKLERLDFLQEGHRLEIVDNADALELQYKGVVLNEMKGVMSDANNLFATKVQQALMDGTIYGHVSGGDPAVIPELTYGELRAFHGKHYHPSNACFYSYGDLPLTEHLQFLDEQILSQFEFRADSASVHVDNSEVDALDLIKKTAPTKLLVIPGPTSNMTSNGDAAASEDAAISGGHDRDSNVKFCTAKYLPVSSTDPFETFVMRLVGYLLTNGPSSPLYRALIDSGLALDFAVGTGFDTSTYYPTFGVAVEGIAGEEVLPEIHAAIRDAYEGVVQNGFEPERVEALLHQLELTLKHIVGNFGLGLMHGVSSVWTHRGDVMENLQLNPLLKRLEREMQANPRFLEHYVRDLLLRDETKEVHVLMVPSERYVADQEAREAHNLAELLTNMSNKDLERIARTTAELDAYQKKEQPVECLPTLTLDDIPRKLPESDREQVHRRLLVDGVVPADFVDVATTNELSYIRVLCDTTDRLPVEYHQYVPLFTTVLGSLGTSRLQYDALPTVIQNCSGGISCSALSNPSLTDAATSSQQSILLATLALPHKLDDALGLMHELLTDTQFLAPDNLKQLRILLQMSAANASSSISSSGAALAGKRARVGLTQSAFYNELYGGLTQVELLQKWAQASDEELGRIARVLQDMARVLFTPDNMKISIVTETKLRDSVSASLEKQLLTPLQERSSDPTGLLLPSLAPLPSLQALQTAATTTGSSLNARLFVPFPISVNFVAETLPSVPFAHADHVPLTVLAQIMSSCYVHQRVREQGGAYGSGVSQGEGSFSLSSHYDPNTTATLTAYEDARQWAMRGEFSERDIHEALLSIFASVDAPQTPSMKGKMSFLRGITNDMRQQRREQYLAVDQASLARVAQQYFTKNEDGADDHSHVVIVGKEAEAAELARQGFAVQHFAT